MTIFLDEITGKLSTELIVVTESCHKLQHRYVSIVFRQSQLQYLGYLSTEVLFMDQLYVLIVILNTDRDQCKHCIVPLIIRHSLALSVGLIKLVAVVVQPCWKALLVEDAQQMRVFGCLNQKVKALKLADGYGL